MKPRAISQNRLALDIYIPATRILSIVHVQAFGQLRQASRFNLANILEQVQNSGLICNIIMIFELLKKGLKTILPVIKRYREPVGT